MNNTQIQVRLSEVINFEDAKDLADELRACGHVMGTLIMVLIEEIETQRAQIKDLLKIFSANSKPDAQIQIIGLGTLKR
jgi:hypothetical protein